MLKRILAIVGIIFLLSLYVITLIFAIIDNPNTLNMLGASIGATVLIPVTLWLFIKMFFSKKD